MENREFGSVAALPSSQKLCGPSANNVSNTRCGSGWWSIRRLSRTSAGGGAGGAGGGTGSGGCGRAGVASRKFASSSRPYSVQIDSGWNCTPHSGRVRWATPHQESVLGPGDGLEVVGHPVDDQRVVAHRLERGGNAGEQPGAGVPDP